MDSVVEDYKKYVIAIQMKDKLKHFAERKNKERNDAWKEYYKHEKEVKTLAMDLGLDEDEAFIADVVTDAPKKRKVEVIDLTK